MRAGLLLGLWLGLVATVALAQGAAEKTFHLDRVMRPVEAFAQQQVDDLTKTTVEDFMAKLKADEPELFAKNEREVRAMMEELPQIAIDAMVFGIRESFAEIFTTADLKRWADRMDGAGWRPSDLRRAFKLPQFKAGLAQAKQLAEYATIVYLADEVIPRMKEMGFHARTGG